MKIYISNLNSFSLVSTNSSQKSIFNSNKIINIPVEVPNVPLDNNSSLMYDSETNTLKWGNINTMTNIDNIRNIPVEVPNVPLDNNSSLMYDSETNTLKWGNINTITNTVLKETYLFH